MKEDIKSILEYAVWAPSGDNSQPWRFRIKNNQIFVYLIRNRDNPILNFNHSGTYIAQGALIENIKIAASHFSYDSSITLLPDPNDHNLIANIILNKNLSVRENPLFPFIKERHTNRKPYKKTSLSPEQVNEIVSLTEQNCYVILIQNKKVISEVANACSITERVALETQALHKLFFNSIVWSRKQEQKRTIGLYHKTLELPAPVLAAFKVIKYWPITKVLNKLGFSKKAAAGNAKTYASSAAMGIIVIEEPTNLNFIRAGQLMQKVWLTITRLGLNLQPVTGTLFLAQRVITNELGELLPQHASLIKDAHEIIKNAFNINKGTLAMQFRIGYADKATARSNRIPPYIEE